MNTTLTGFPKPYRGKVRDIYDLGDKLLIVTSDRISVFDVILPTPIPEKGEILTHMSRFWFARTSHIIPNHLLEQDVGTIIHDAALQKTLDGRTMIVKKCNPLPIEAIVRGYVSGSGWKEYQKTGTIAALPLPRGLALSAALPNAIFTPSTKAKLGSHDENISFATMCDLIGKDLGLRIRDTSLKIYNESAAYARTRGIIIADTKFEFGLCDGELTLIDEILTPDSSRFWPADLYHPGGPQPSFDKQFVRDYVEGLDWNKKAPGPPLPPEIVEKTRQKYHEALTRLTTP